MNNDTDADVALAKKHLNELGEHFDAVQIFATRHEAGELNGTINVQVGVGNWYSRYGHIQEWMIKQDELMRIKTREDQ